MAAIRDVPSVHSPAEGVQRRLVASDRTALADLYGLYARRVYGLALWWSGAVEEAEDIVQETFVRVWENATWSDAPTMSRPIC